MEEELYHEIEIYFILLQNETVDRSCIIPTHHHINKNAMDEELYHANLINFIHILMIYILLFCTMDLFIFSLKIQSYSYSIIIISCTSIRFHL